MMMDFNSEIMAVRSYMEERQGSVLEVPGPELPVRYGRDIPPFVVLNEDAAVELGSPLVGSTGMVLCTDDKGLVYDGRITLIGPDIPDMVGKSVPFGQVILVAGETLTDDDLPKIERVRDISSLLEGYMLRQAPKKIWSRVSKEAVQKGFNLATLGAALMMNYREKLSVDAIEILFVTASREAVDDLSAIADKAHQHSLAVRKDVRQRSGLLNCEGVDCHTCPDKLSCDTIRDIRVIRKAGKIERIEFIRKEKETEQENDSATDVNKDGECC
jgi:CO dehydrogenase/acetyl-CoA synthase beta subunit